MTYLILEVFVLTQKLRSIVPSPTNIAVFQPLFRRVYLSWGCTTHRKPVNVSFYIRFFLVRPLNRLFSFNFQSTQMNMISCKNPAFFFAEYPNRLSIDPSNPIQSIHPSIHLYRSVRLSAPNYDTVYNTIFYCKSLFNSIYMRTVQKYNIEQFEVPRTYSCMQASTHTHVLPVLICTCSFIYPHESVHDFSLNVCCFPAPLENAFTIF